MKEKRNTNFRLSGVHLYLTYARFSSDREEILKQLQKKLKIEQYAIGTDHHRDGGEHVHIYLHLRQRCDIKNPRRLDLLDKEGMVVHGHYSVCRSITKVLKYIASIPEENLLTNIGLLKNTGEKKKKWREILDSVIKNEKTVKETLLDIGELSPQMLLRNSNSLEKSILNIKEILKENEKARYSVSDFREIKKCEEYFEEYTKKKTLVLIGGTGIGKTEYCKSMLEKLPGKGGILRVTEKQDLKKLAHGDFKGIILDDLPVDEFQGEKALHLFDIENSGSQRILYRGMSIPVGMPRVFISNRPLKDLFEKTSKEHFAGIKRRVIEVKLGKRSLKRKTKKIERIEEKGEKIEEKGEKIIY